MKLDGFYILLAVADRERHGCATMQDMAPPVSRKPTLREYGSVCVYGGSILKECDTH
jgi:hypothetical protein